MPSSNLPRLERTDQRQQYSTVYVLESEVHSTGGHDWHEIDFPMWYNLARSYPEPATYFDIKVYLDKLFAPVRVPFSKKNEKASVIWIISNWYETVRPLIQTNGVLLLLVTLTTVYKRWFSN